MEKRIIGNNLEVSDLVFGRMGLNFSYGKGLEKRDTWEKIEAQFKINIAPAFNITQ